jgi:LmbE family N-acetylglucosaminyl deacetylase
MPHYSVCLALIAFGHIVIAQPVKSPPPDERFRAEILVIVAHPDDESLIAGYLARAVLDEHRRVAVVFATRGDAGQNLVGYEQARSLAEIRETEARQALVSIGIHNVWFLRAPDTPYPDVPDVLRSLGTWNHGNVLGEMVRLIRLTRPEVVITMLPDVVVGENHEDHQASGVVATEAFDLAGDPSWFPEQVAAPEDRLWYSNLMEGLHTWQPKKLYYFTDASHLDFVRGKGPEYSMTDASPSQHTSYARLAATELSFHQTQYDGEPAHALATGELRYFEQPLTFILGKSLVGGLITGDIFQGMATDPIPFRPVRGYQQPSILHQGAMEGFRIELGGGWAFYNRFWSSHNLDSMPGLLAPELGVGSGQNFPVPLLLHNNTDNAVIFNLQTRLPPGWSIDSNSTQFAHHALPGNAFLVDAHDYFPVRMRLVAPRISKSQWQEISWTSEADGKSAGSVTLKVYVEANQETH